MQTRTTWWGSVVSTVSSLLSKEPSLGSENTSRTSIPETAPRTRQARFCNVCGETFKSELEFHRHIVSSDSSPCCPAVFPSSEAADVASQRYKMRIENKQARTRDRQRKDSVGDGKHVKAEKDPDEVLSLPRTVPESRQQSTDGQGPKLRIKRFLTYKESFIPKDPQLHGSMPLGGSTEPTASGSPKTGADEAFTPDQHLDPNMPTLSNHISKPDYRDVNLTQQIQQLAEQVRLLQEKLGSLPALSTSSNLSQASAVDSLARKIRNILANASNRHRMSTKALVLALKDLDAMSSPRIRSITDRIRQQLQLIESEADLKNDYRLRKVLEIYHKHNLLHAGSHGARSSEGPYLSERAEVPSKKNPAQRETFPEHRLSLATIDPSSQRTQMEEDWQQVPRYFRYYRTTTLGPEAEPLQQARNVARASETENPSNIRERAGQSGSLSPSLPHPLPNEREAFPVQQSSFIPFAPTKAQSPWHGTPGETKSISPTISNEERESAKESGLSDVAAIYETTLENKSDNQRLIRQIHTQASLMRPFDPSNPTSSSSEIATSERGSLENSAAHVSSAEPTAPATGEVNEQSLLEELFPEASSYIQPHYSRRNPYPKLDPPSAVPVIRRQVYDAPKSRRDQVIESFQKHSEQVTALQLLHCSTELTEADFRRLVPKGQHIESWARDGEFYKIIPGRDPLSLERLPFYYLLFKSPESALAYQNNVVRLHKLSQLHQPSNIFSAIPPPKGFLEDGEDINLATSSYLLKPTGLPLSLNMVMQPYNAALRTLVDQGGYRPIVPSSGEERPQVWKVLMHIEGYEPSQSDLYQLISQDAHARGIQWPFHNEQSAIHRLRDIVNLKSRMLPVSSANPRAANPDRHFSHHLTNDDPSLSFLAPPQHGEHESAMQINQMVMNRVYNRWVIEFEEEDAARRFARMWHRKPLPVSKSSKHVTWRDVEEVRMCNAEFLW